MKERTLSLGEGKGQESVETLIGLASFGRVSTQRIDRQDITLLSIGQKMIEISPVV